MLVIGNLDDKMATKDHFGSRVVRLKKAFMFFCCMLSFTFGVHGQNSLSYSEITQIVFSNRPISLEFIKDKCLKADRKIYSIYDLDIFGYYNVRDCNTELQKEVYKNTPEYRTQLSELEKMKNNLSQTTYYYEDKDLFTSSSAKYDVKRRGFNLEMRENISMGLASSTPPKSISIGGSYIHLKSLPTQIVENHLLGKGFTIEMLFIQLDAENGIEIEKNWKDIRVYFLFTPNSKETLEYIFYNSVNSSSDGWYNMKDQVITSTRVRVVVANKENGKIYYDKIYTLDGKDNSSKSEPSVSKQSEPPITKQNVPSVTQPSASSPISKPSSTSVTKQNVPSASKENMTATPKYLSLPTQTQVVHFKWWKELLLSYIALCSLLMILLKKEKVI